MALKASFQSDRNDDGQSGSAATGPDDIHKKPHRDSLNCFLGYHANGQKGLEGAVGSAAATETSCVPLLENQALTKLS